MRNSSGTPFGVVRGLLTGEIGVKSLSANKLPVSPSRRCVGGMGVGRLGKRSFRFKCDDCFGPSWMLSSVVMVIAVALSLSFVIMIYVIVLPVAPNSASGRARLETRPLGFPSFCTGAFCVVL